MAVDRLANLPAGADAFLDANIFIYTFGRQSNECRDLLRRGATDEVFGITTLEVIDEVTHRLMLESSLIFPPRVYQRNRFSPARQHSADRSSLAA
jgi:predicted nucleic acid-binding protein